MGSRFVNLNIILLSKNDPKTFLSASAAFVSLLSIFFYFAYLFYFVKVSLILFQDAANDGRFSYDLPQKMNDPRFDHDDGIPLKMQASGAYFHVVVFSHKGFYFYNVYFL